jgi:hypothetical protein
MARLAAFYEKMGNAQRALRRRVITLYRPCASSVPIFIMGCQRSGTKMVRRAFARSLNATVIYRSDDGVFSPDNRLRSVSEIRDASARSRTLVTVFKPMMEMQNTRKYLDELPQLRVLWILRDYGDVVNSCARRWNTMRGYLLEVARDPERAAWYGENLSQDNLALVRDLITPESSLESAYALFWFLRNSFFFEYELHREERVRLFRYEDLVRDPGQGFDEMFSFCGCPYRRSVIKEVDPTFIARHPQPLIDPRIEALCRSLSARFDALRQTPSRG